MKALEITGIIFVILSMILWTIRFIYSIIIFKDENKSYFYKKEKEKFYESLCFILTMFITGLLFIGIYLLETI